MTDKITKLVDKLHRDMEHADDWERRKTSIPGIFIVKMPKELRIRLEFNPPNDSGDPSKRKGLFFEDMETVQAARKAFSDGRVEELVEAVHKFNGDTGRKSGGNDEIFEI